MVPTVASRIRQAIPNLPRAERRVARTLLADYPAAGLQTVARLAGEAEVSAPTVLKLVERLGFSSYGDFQQALREELRQRQQSPLDQYPEEPDELHVVARGRSAFTRCVTRTFDDLDTHQFDRAVDLLSAPRRRVFTTGGRFSSVAARSLALHLEVLRPSVRFLGLEDRSSALVGMGAQDVVFAIDLRRYQTGTIRFARASARRGAHLVLLTDRWHSPVAPEAEVVLTAALDAPRPFDSLVGAAVVVETLVAGVVDRLGDGAKPRVRAYDEAWDAADGPHPESGPDAAPAPARAPAAEKR